jgi:hypothetical protein
MNTILTTSRETIQHTVVKNIRIKVIINHITGVRTTKLA